MKELARRYAEALYGQYTDEIQLKAAADALVAVPALWEALISPAVRPEEKERLLSRIADGDPPALVCFLKLLAEKGRMTLLPDIVREFSELALNNNNAAACVLTCVREPDEKTLERLKVFLCKAHNKSEVRLNVCIDPSVIGGFILNIEGVTYDQSVRGRLRRLSRHLEEVNTYER